MFSYKYELWDTTYLKNEVVGYTFSYLYENIGIGRKRSMPIKKNPI